MWKTKQKTTEPENLQKAYDYAVFLLSLQLRTEGEVNKKMQERGYTEKVIGVTLARLKENRYLDDWRYAEVYVDNLKKYKSFGYYGIKKKLMEKRLPADIIESVLSQGLDEDEESQIAEKFLKKHKVTGKQKILNRSSAEADSDAKTKLAQKLRARGFRNGVILACLKM